MPEAGGPTAQSGILYQNSIAALYLGRLLDSRPTPNSQRVIGVRLEAPEGVDDVIVTYENGTRLLIQAKEALTVGSAPWKAFWAALKAQYTRGGGSAERYLLAIGTVTPDLDILRELCDRCQGKDTVAEWTRALAAAHKSLLKKILDTIQIDAAEIFAMARRLTVEFQTLHHIETAGVRDAIPASSVTLENLFSILRDACGGGARVRATFDAVSLVDRLATTYKVTLTGAPGDGLPSYLAALEAKYGAIVVPGTVFRGQLDDLLTKPTIELVNAAEPGDFEDESHFRRRSSSGEIFELSGFPRAARKHLLLEAGAGFGKSTILHAVLLRLARERVFVPALVVADDLASSSGILDYLERHLNTNFRVTLDWMALCRQGRAVLMIDGVDELADHARTAALDDIEQVAAMFPTVPILVAARDRSALSLPTKFSRCKILRLSKSQADNLLNSYLSQRPEILSDSVRKSLVAAKDLSALCSIPLFLALLVATLPRSGHLPKGRAELLERYLSLVLAPQRHKSGPQPHTSVTNLRRAAEILALNGLRQNSVAQVEDAGRRMLGESLGQALADHCTDDLLQCGLLVRRGARIGFPIATVQEYLAGCALAAGEPEVGAWFKQIARRPWAQAVQFALERIPNAEPALVTQIDLADDLFHTSLRVIARSVVNGGRSSPEFRRRLVERLLAAWITGSWRARRDIAELLADGLAIPPTPELADLLVKTGDAVSDGALLLKLGDRDLALRTLKSLLKKSDIRDLWSSNWIDVVKMIGVDAVELMIARLSDPGFIVEEVIAAALYRLRDVRSIDWIEISERRDIPSRIAVACLWGAQRQNTPDGQKMISSLLETLADNAVKDDRHIVQPWVGFSEAYLGTDWWQQHFASVLVGGADSERQRAAIFNALIDVRYEAASHGIALAAEIRRNVISAKRDTILFDALVCATSFDDAALRSDMIVALSENADIKKFQIWAGWMPYFSDVHKVMGLNIIKNKIGGSRAEVNFVLSLMSTINFIPSDTRQIAARGSFGTSYLKTPSRVFTCEWARDVAARLNDDTERLLLTSQLMEIDGDGAGLLIEALHAFAARGVPGHNNDWNWVITAVHALERRDHQINIELMFRLVKLFPTFPTHSFFAMLMRQRGAAVTDQLCEFYADAAPSIRAQILSGLEDVAQSLGVAVSRNSAGRLRLDWAG